MTSLADQFEALKPCPFCGGAAHVSNSRSRYFMATCSNCACHFAENFGTEADAIAAWNNRTAISSALTSAPPVQEGWVLVPREPTEAMWNKVWSAYHPWRDNAPP